MFIDKISFNILWNRYYLNQINFLANLVFKNSRKDTALFVHYFYKNFLKEYRELSTKDLEEIDLKIYFIDDIFWDIEQYLVDKKYIRTLTYNALNKIAENNLEERELFIIKTFLGLGIQIGEPLSIVEFMEKYSFEYNVTEIINSIGNYFCIIINLEKKQP